MFQHILVPLDGSKRAENAIPVAATIARATGGSILLLQVVTLPSSYAVYLTEPVVFTPEVATDDYQMADVYLKEREHTPELHNLPVQTRIMTGMPAQQILSCIETENIDLMVMCSRGETGLTRWAMGSVTQKVVRHSAAPVLVLHESAGLPGNEHPAGRRPVRILVALDGSALSETALKPAAVVAAALSAPEKGTLHLVRVLPLHEPTNAAEALSEIRELDITTAEMYLHMTKQMLEEEIAGKLALSVETSVVAHLDVADTLIRTAEDGIATTGETSACDIIALTTHSRSGLARWVAGSVAERIMDGTRLPLLVVRPALPQEAQEWGALKSFTSPV